MAAQLIRVSRVAIEGLPQDDTCIICMEEWAASFDILGDFPIRLPCPGGHIVGANCMMEYLRSGKDTCPLCRFPLGEAIQNGLSNLEDEQFFLDPRLGRPCWVGELNGYVEEHEEDQHGDGEEGGHISDEDVDSGDDDDGDYISDDDMELGDAEDGDSTSDEESLTSDDDMLTIAEGRRALRRG